MEQVCGTRALHTHKQAAAAVHSCITHCRKIAAALPLRLRQAADESLGKRFQPEPRWHLLHSIALIDTDGRMAGLDYQIAERN